MKAIIIVALGAFLSACATSTTAPTPVAVDSFCVTAKKRTWSINDSPESIRDAEIWNRQIDIRCGAQKT